MILSYWCVLMSFFLQSLLTLWKMHTIWYCLFVFTRRKPFVFIMILRCSNANLLQVSYIYGILNMWMSVNTQWHLSFTIFKCLDMSLNYFTVHFVTLIFIEVDLTGWQISLFASCLVCISNLTNVTILSWCVRNMKWIWKWFITLWKTHDKILSNWCLLISFLQGLLTFWSM